MNRIVVTSKVGADGVLHLEIPVGAEEANREVRVVIEPAPEPKPEMTQEEWHAWVMSMVGSITDPTFRRHEQGEYEERDELP